MKPRPDPLRPDPPRPPRPASPPGVPAITAAMDRARRDLIQILAVSDPIDEETYGRAVGVFSKYLKALLRSFHTLSPPAQDKLRPFLLYARQVQHYLVFLLRFPGILGVPHHSEIEQTLKYLQQQESLVSGLYADLAAQQKALVHGQFSRALDAKLARRGHPDTTTSDG